MHEQKMHNISFFCGNREQNNAEAVLKADLRRKECSVSAEAAGKRCRDRIDLLIFLNNCLHGAVTVL